jgi:glycosyltransferase involved in cell wall biosynthesis
VGLTRLEEPPKGVRAGPLRISLVGPVHPYRGGIVHYTTLLARALAERHALQILTFRRQYPAWLYPGKTDKDVSRQPLTLPVSPRHRLDPFRPWTWWATVHEMARFAPDVAILQWWTTVHAPACGALARLLRRRRIRPVFLIHNALPHERRPWDGPLARLALSGGAAFLVHSQGEAGRVRDLVPAARTLWCALPRYDMFAADPPSRLEARQRMEWPIDASVALFFGIVRPYKGLSHLIDAMGLLRRRAERVHLVVAGEFWEDRHQYERQIARLGLTDHVRLIDRYIPNEQVPDLFAAADVLVAPYVAGTQSGAVSVARGFGLPVIVTRAEWLPPDGDDGIHVPPGDAGALAEAIAAAASRRTRRPPAATASAAVQEWRAVVDAIERCARDEAR